jgi:hypothetical protein
MSEYTIGQIKKEAEQEALSYFLDAYESATGETLEIIEATERPDFICVRPNGACAGIELVRVMRGHPDEVLWDKLVEKQATISLEVALDMIQRIAKEKEEKRKKPDWKLAETTILVIELRDISLSEIKRCITINILPDLFEGGFEEVWLADCSEIEVDENIELFCIKPEKWRGGYSRGIKKPYG